MQTTPNPTFRIVRDGKELLSYQTEAHRDAFLKANKFQVVEQNVDSITFNLHTVYVA